MNLFIDTHLNDVVIMLFDKSGIIKEKQLFNVKENSRVIMPTIKNILGDNNPNSILVVNGPGSFTGVRLGVTIAKTLAYTLDIPIRTITSLECLAVSLERDEKIVGFSDKNGYFIGIFDEFNNLVGNYEYLSNVEFGKYNSLYHVETDILVNYENVFKYAMNKDSINPHKVNPVYIKKLAVEK